LDNAIHVTEHCVAADHNTLTLVKAERIADKKILVVILVEHPVAQEVVIAIEPTIVNAIVEVASHGGSSGSRHHRYQKGCRRKDHKDASHNKRYLLLCVRAELVSPALGL
jgi:hypothetical protein